MTPSTLLVLIIIAIVIFLLWKLLKPYVIKYDSTILLTGGVGSGKTLNAVSMVNLLYRKTYIFNYILGNLKIKIKNLFRKKNEKLKRIPKPRIYTNMPMSYKPWVFGHRVMSYKITPLMMSCHKGIREYSIVLLDELPQMINQFNWDEKLIKENVNEFITFFRHYIGGYLIVTAQSESDIVVQIRRKLNTAIWCRNFKTHFFKTFYTVEMTTLLLSDNVTNINQTQLEENTKHKFGLLIGKSKMYNTRCFSERYKNILEQPKLKDEKWPSDTLKTNEIMRFIKYNSPLDDNTSENDKKIQAKQVKDLQNYGKNKN